MRINFIPESIAHLAHLVSAANDYKVLAHSDIHLPIPLSPPRTRSVTSSSRSGNKSDTPTDSSAYTAALVSALNAQLGAARAQVARERADSERKIARLEAMVELRDVELKRNLSRSVNAPEGNSIANVSGEGAMSGSETGSRRSAGMSRGEAISAYENVARDNERLEKEVTRLKAAVRSSYVQMSLVYPMFAPFSSPPPNSTALQAKYIHLAHGPNSPSGLDLNRNRHNLRPRTPDLNAHPLETSKRTNHTMCNLNPLTARLHPSPNLTLRRYSNHLSNARTRPHPTQHRTAKAHLLPNQLEHDRLRRHLTHIEHVREHPDPL